MSKYNNRKHSASFSELTELPLEIMSAVPIFQLFSDKEMIIEGAKNLEYYDENCARIMTEKLYVIIQGEKLTIKCLANKNLSVCGNINSIQLEKQKQRKK